MSSAEMTIRLVDATVEEQAALERTPTFNDGGTNQNNSVPPSRTEASTTTGANVREGISSDVPKSGWMESMDRLRDAMLSVYERFTPKAFQEPIERLINALDPRDERGITTIPPPVQTDVEAKPLVDHIRPNTPEPEQNQERRKETDSASVPRWMDSLLQRSGIGRRALQTYQSTRRNISSAVSATKPIVSRLANTSIGRAVAPAMQRAGGFAKATVGTVAKRLGFPAASAAASVGAKTSAAAGSSASVGAAAIANPVGITVAAVTAAFVAVAVAAKALANTFESEAQRLAPYSGAIATAQANTQVNTELNMLDRAQRNESGLARFETARGGITNQMEKLWTQILSLLLKMEPALTTGANAISVTLAETTKIVALIEGIVATSKASAAAWTPGNADDAMAAADLAKAAAALAAASAESQKAWGELRGITPSVANTGIDKMLQSVLDTELDAKGNVKKKHGGAHGQP